MGKRRNLKAHNKLLLDVIKRQAGTLEKAILEADMNRVEAGSPWFRITLEHNGIEAGKPGAKLILEDGGRGFRSEKEIHEWFETFGQPHAETEKKTWAQFRMGRGQMFAYGRNVWRTGQFEMTVDIDNMGLEYNLETGLPNFKGCRIEIELYENPIGMFHYPSIEKLKLQIKRQIEFMPGKTTFNGERLNTPAEECEWTYQDADAYYLFGTGYSDLTFYNLGAFVEVYSATRAGVTGVIVSKKQLQVNFARNQVQDSCPVFRNILEVVKQNRIKKTRKSRTLDEYTRDAMLVDIRDGDVDFKDVRAVALVELTNGKRMSLDQLRKTRIPWTFAPKGDRVADRLLWHDEAVCINEDIKTQLGFTDLDRNFFHWLLRHYMERDYRRYSKGMDKQWEQMARMWRPFETDDGETGLANGISRVNKVLPEKLWTDRERRIIKALTRVGSYMNGDAKEWDNRTLTVGTSETALAWTDGSTFIAFSRSYLQRLQLGGRGAWGCSHLVITGLHEVAHTDATEDSHDHGFAYYKRFHDIVGGPNYASGSPTCIVHYLVGMLNDVKREQHQEKVERKERKAKDRRDTALGLNGDKKKATKTRTPAKPKPKKRRQRRF
ncbi:MAG: hypothetical protein ACXAC5_02145 [Promethearchaeota archaeon]|jgi:hypothetical protein